MTIDQLFAEHTDYTQNRKVFTFYDVKIGDLTWPTVSVDLENHIVEFYDACGNLHDTKRIRIYLI